MFIYIIFQNLKNTSVFDTFDLDAYRQFADKILDFYYIHFVYVS